MKCPAAKILLQDLIDGSLSGTDTGLIVTHLHECAACREDYQQTLNIIERLKATPVPQPSAGFAERVLADAGRSRQVEAGSRMKWVSTGIAASLAAIVLMLSVQMSFEPIDSVPAIVLVDGEVKTIRLAIESSRTIEDIEMTINVSDNLKIDGYGDQQAITWTTRLEPGVNLIALPVTAIVPGDGEIVARVGLHDNQKVFRVRTRFRPAGSVSIESSILAGRQLEQQSVRL